MFDNLACKFPDKKSGTQKTVQSFGAKPMMMTPTMKSASKKIKKLANTD